METLVKKNDQSDLVHATIARPSHDMALVSEAISSGKVEGHFSKPNSERQEFLLQAARKRGSEELDNTITAAQAVLASRK